MGIYVGIGMRIRTEGEGRAEPNNKDLRYAGCRDRAV